jgi:hypothetical protein
MNHEQRLALLAKRTKPAFPGNANLPIGVSSERPATSISGLAS